MMRRNYMGGLLIVPLLLTLPFIVLFRCGQWLWDRATPMNGTVHDLREMRVNERGGRGRRRNDRGRAR